MLFTLLLIATSAVWVNAQSNDTDESTLRFVQVWFRHGERLPTHFLSFPSDPPLEPHYLELAEPGELTARGINQAYSLGGKIRQHYGTFLGSYRPSQIHVWTGKDNRTVTSAQAVMAGIYPASGSKIWNDDLDWQPVSMHTDESIDWLSTGIEHECPLYEKAIFSSQEYKDIPFQLNQTVLKYLSEKAGGVPVNNVLDVNHLLDSLRVRMSLNDSRLPVPEWSKPALLFLKPLHEQLHSAMLNMENNTVGGYHLEQILSYMEDHLLRPENKKNRAVFLAGHDTNMMAIGKAFNIPQMSSILPDFASYFVAELHFIGGEYIVKFFYSPGLDISPQSVSPAHCPSPCTLARLQDAAKGSRVGKTSMMLTCNGLGLVNTEATIVGGSMIALIAILLISTVILACTTCSYRRQLKELNDPERRRLI